MYMYLDIGKFSDELLTEFAFYIPDLYKDKKIDIRLLNVWTRYFID